MWFTGNEGGAALAAARRSVDGNLEIPMYRLEDERIEVEGRSSAKVETLVVLSLLDIWTSSSGRTNYVGVYFAKFS